jgi:PKHD-type hydroxylase
MTSGTLSVSIKRNQQLAKDSVVAKELGAIVLQALNANEMFFSAALPSFVMPPQFNRYENSLDLGNHIENAAGDMILYPSTSLHRVEPVTRGARLASFFWIQSMVCDVGKRAVLFDLYTSIRQLRQQGGSHDIATQLTGTSHNLLRRWAEL